MFYFIKLLSGQGSVLNTVCKLTQAYLFTCCFIRSNTLDQGDGKWIKLVGLMSFVNDGERNTESQPF